jgi:hypothetical protein
MASDLDESEEASSESAVVPVWHRVYLAGPRHVRVQDPEVSMRCPVRWRVTRVPVRPGVFPPTTVARSGLDAGVTGRQAAAVTAKRNRVPDGR